VSNCACENVPLVFGTRLILRIYKCGMNRVLTPWSVVVARNGETMGRAGLQWTILKLRSESELWRPCFLSPPNLCISLSLERGGRHRCSQAVPQGLQISEPKKGL